MTDCPNENPESLAFVYRTLDTGRDATAVFNALMDAVARHTDPISVALAVIESLESHGFAIVEKVTQ